MKGIRVNLPAANSPPPPPNQVKDYVSVRVTEGNLTYFDNQPVNDDQVLPRLYEMFKQNKDVKISLSAEQNALHGDVIRVLDKIRSAGIQKIGYQIKTASPQGAPGTTP
jgi:biopolymer transport protein ExbD